MVILMVIIFEKGYEYKKNSSGRFRFPYYA